MVISQLLNMLVLFTITNVLYIPNISFNLLSVPKLCETLNCTVSFYVLISFIPFLYFFYFCGRQGCFPLLLRIPQLRWGNQTYVVLFYAVFFLGFFCIPYLPSLVFRWSTRHHCGASSVPPPLLWWPLVAVPCTSGTREARHPPWWLLILRPNLVPMQT